MLSNMSRARGGLGSNLALFHSDHFVSGLLSDGDSRIHTEGRSGLNKYLCRATPSPELICASSCTASPISQTGFDRAADFFALLTSAATPHARRILMAEQANSIEHCLLRHFKAVNLAEVILCPSGTDALLTTARLLAAERPGAPMTAILPSASETGTGVPLAATCRDFDGQHRGKPRPDYDVRAVEVALRAANGAPLADDAVDSAFAAAASHAKGRPVVYLTHGSKTDLIAPRTPPAGADVIVDACQARIDPTCVAAFLRRGWPVIITGSKFFGGPAFSGAVLFPLGRRVSLPPQRIPSGGAAGHTPGLGMILRWTAALDAIERFSSVGPSAAAFLQQRGASIRRAIAANPALVPIASATRRGFGWADQPSIFTFAIRDPVVRARLLTAMELRPIYERLAGEGKLLGQPAEIGAFGGLRVALGARDLDQDSPDGFEQVICAIGALGRERVASPSDFAVAASGSALPL